MGCKDANARLKANTDVAIKGESTHPMHVHQMNGVEAGKAMYNRFFGKKK